MGMAASAAGASAAEGWLAEMDWSRTYSGILTSVLQCRDCALRGGVSILLEGTFTSNNNNTYSGKNISLVGPRNHKSSTLSVLLYSEGKHGEESCA